MNFKMKVSIVDQAKFVFRIDDFCRLASCIKGLIYVQLHLDCSQ